MEHKINKNKFGMGILLFVAGIITGILLAKKSGKELQNNLKNEFKKIKYKLKKSFNSIDSNVKDIKKKFVSEGLPEFNSKLTETLQAIKDNVRDSKDSYTGIVDERNNPCLK